MLAHLAVFGLKSKSRPLLVLASAAFVAVLASPARGADLLPPGAFDQGSTHTTSSADTGIKGSVASGIRVSTGTSVVKAVPEAPGDGRALVRDANRMSLYLGTALTKTFALTLGLTGTYEHVKPESRDEIFAEEASSLGLNSVTWRDSLKQTGFSGATLAMKMKLLDDDSLKLALMPFLESGVGERGSFSMTRSVGAKAGFMGLVTYGAKGVGEVSVNAGYRYREPEELGGIVLRNEAFYRMAVSGNVSSNLSIFAAADGRKLMVAPNVEERAEGEKLAYRGNESGEAVGGFKALLGDLDVSVFGGGRFKEAKGMGFGAHTFGASVTMVLSGARQAPKASAAKKIDDEIEREAKPAKLVVEEEANGRPADMQYTKDDYPEMIGAEIDPLESVKDAGEGDDFADVEKTIKENEKNAHIISEDEKIERELKAIREAEKKAAEERAKAERTLRNKKRKEAVKRAKEDEVLMKEWEAEAKKDADSFEGISQDEMDWSGLE